MYDKTEQVVADRYAWWCSAQKVSVQSRMPDLVDFNVPRVEPRQLTVAERMAVIQAHQLHEHVGDEHAQVLYFTRLVLERHDLDVGFWRAQPFGGRPRHLLFQRGSCIGRHDTLLLLLLLFPWSFPRRSPALRLGVLVGLLLLLLLGDRRLRVNPQRRLGRRWRLRRGSRNRGGNLCPLCIHDGGRAEGRGGGCVGGRRRGWVVGGGIASGRVLGAGVGVGVGSLGALRRGRGAAEQRHGFGGLRRVEAPRCLGAHGEGAGRVGAGRGRGAARGMVRRAVAVGKGGRGRRRRGDGGRRRGQHREAPAAEGPMSPVVVVVRCTILVPAVCGKDAPAAVAQHRHIQYSAHVHRGRINGRRLWSLERRGSTGAALGDVKGLLPPSAHAWPAR